MFNKNVVLSLVIFTLFMVLTSYIKTQTRMIEKKIVFYEKEISNLQNNLHESQLDFYYLSSPDYITNKIKEFSNQEYSVIKHSKIYLSLEQFLNQQNKTTINFMNEKKIEKK